MAFYKGSKRGKFARLQDFAEGKRTMLISTLIYTNANILVGVVYNISGAVADFYKVTKDRRDNYLNKTE